MAHLLLALCHHFGQPCLYHVRPYVQVRGKELVLQGIQGHSYNLQIVMCDQCAGCWHWEKAQTVVLQRALLALELLEDGQKKSSWQWSVTSLSGPMSCYCKTINNFVNHRIAI